HHHRPVPAEEEGLSRAAADRAAAPAPVDPGKGKAPVSRGFLGRAARRTDEERRRAHLSLPARRRKVPGAGGPCSGRAFRQADGALHKVAAWKPPLLYFCGFAAARARYLPTRPDPTRRPAAAPGARCGRTDRRGGAGDGRRGLARGGLSCRCDGHRRGVRGVRLAHRKTLAGGSRRTHVHASAGRYRAQVAGDRCRARPGDERRRSACNIRAGRGPDGLPGVHDRLALVASMIRDFLRAAGDSPSEYVTHHLKHWQVSIGEGAFWTLNIDSLLVSVLVGVLTMGTFWLVGRRA